jgi:uncharacterized membrane protein
MQVGLLATITYFFLGLDLDTETIRKTYPRLILAIIEAVGVG